MANTSNKYNYHSIAWCLVAIMFLYESSIGTLMYINTGSVYYYRDSDFIFQGIAAITALFVLYLISILSLYAGYKYYKAYKTGKFN